jgi:hypothetical protein
LDVQYAKLDELVEQMFAITHYTICMSAERNKYFQVSSLIVQVLTIMSTLQQKSH